MASEIQGFSDFKEALRLYKIGEVEVDLIQQYKEKAHEKMGSFVEEFYGWMPEVPEYKDLFSRAGLVEQVKARQTLYWKELFECNLNEDYFDSRWKVGGVHASINLPISSYVAMMSFTQAWWAGQVSSEQENSVELIKALNKLLLLDVAIVSSSYSQASNDLIEKQSRALMELSTPTIQLWEGVLVLPVLGVIDSHRAQDMTEVMLNKIQQTNADVIIIDITGVPAVDSSVANHLIKITKATRLMGCECILSGIGPEIAQTLVHLGVNLDSVETSSNLKAAFQVSLVKAGFYVTQKD